MVASTIKQNMEYFNIKKKDVSLLAGIPVEELELVLKSKVDISQTLASKLDKIFHFPDGLMYSYYERSKLLESAMTSEQQQIFNYLISCDMYKLAHLKSVEQTTKELFYGSLENYKSFVSFRTFGFNGGENDPLSYLWFFLCDKKYRRIEKDCWFSYEKYENVMNYVIGTIFDKGSFRKRFNEICRWLKYDGIVIRGEPHIRGTKLKSVTIDMYNHYNIYLTDEGKKESRIWLSLIHELVHIFEKNANHSEEQIDKIARKHVDDYLKNNGIKNVWVMMQIEDEEAYDKNECEWKLSCYASFGKIYDFLKTITN